MEVVNDSNCSWINDLIPRTNINVLNSNLNCDWLVVGAGFTGLSAARKLSEIKRTSKIIIIDAQLAGEGGSGRIKSLIKIV